MGAEGSKSKKANSGKFKAIENRFKSISRSKSGLLKIDLEKTWSANIDTTFYKYLENYLYNRGVDAVNFDVFKSLYLNLCEEGLDEKGATICKIVKNNKDAQNISKSEMSEFISGVLKSIVMVCKTTKQKNFQKWLSKHCPTGESEVAKYSEYFLTSFAKDKIEYSSHELRQVVQSIDLLLLSLVTYLYKPDTVEMFSTFYPDWCSMSSYPGKSLEQLSVLNAVSILFLNMELPVDNQLEWRLLYSTEDHGESYSKMSGQIINKGASIIIIKDSNGHIFGGFAPVSWSWAAGFVGDSSSFLFTLHPEVNVYEASNFNDHYQYMNFGQQTIPNGLGMGGQFGYFGLWLDAEFGLGQCSESCTTYKNYKRLSSTKNFRVSHVEVWAVGPPPPTAEELGERSVLDGNADAKVLLEMVGREQKSEGIRDLKVEDDE